MVDGGMLLSTDPWDDDILPIHEWVMYGKLVGKYTVLMDPIMVWNIMGF